MKNINAKVDHNNGGKPAELVRKRIGELDAMQSGDANLDFFGENVELQSGQQQREQGVDMHAKISTVGRFLYSEGRRMLAKPDRITQNDAEVFGLEVDMLKEVEERTRLTAEWEGRQIGVGGVVALQRIQMQLLAMLADVSKGLRKVWDSSMTEEEYRHAQKQRREQEGKPKGVKSKGGIIDDQAIAILGELPSDLPARSEDPPARLEQKRQQHDDLLLSWRDPYVDGRLPLSKELLTLETEKLINYVGIVSEKWEQAIGGESGEVIEHYNNLEQVLVEWNGLVALMSKRWNVDLKQVESMTCEEQVQFFKGLVEERMDKQCWWGGRVSRMNTVFEVDKEMCRWYEQCVWDMEKFEKVDFGQSMKDLNKMVEQKISTEICRIPGGLAI